MKASATRWNAARKIRAASVAVCLILVFILTLSLPPLTPPEAASESLGDFFKISYDPATFSKTDILRNEAFSVTIHGNATCINDLPLTVREGRITGNITAVHSVSGQKVTLQSTYTVNINPFPSKQGQSTDMTVTVPLGFPARGEAGQYSVIARTVKAEVFVLGNWSDVTEMFPASVVLGSVHYATAGTTSTPTPTPTTTSTPNVSPTPGSTTSPTATVIPGTTITPTARPVFTPRPTITITANVSSLALNIYNTSISTWNVDATAHLIEDVVATSTDGIITIYMSNGTEITNPNGEQFAELSLTSVNTPPSPTDGKIIIAAFALEPSGVTFDPAIQITIKYDPDTLPAGTDESELMIACFNDTTDKWEFISSPVSVDSNAHTVTFSIGHFSTYAILAPDGSATPVHYGAPIWAAVGLIVTLVLAIIILAIMRLQTRSRRVVECDEDLPEDDYNE